MVTVETRYLLKLYRHYSDGHLMYSGGIMDQPNFYLEAMEFIDNQLKKS